MGKISIEFDYKSYEKESFACKAPCNYLRCTFLIQKLVELLFLLFTRLIKYLPTNLKKVKVKHEKSLQN